VNHFPVKSFHQPSIRPFASARNGYIVISGTVLTLTAKTHGTAT
jgi:hypothetical protein